MKKSTALINLGIAVVVAIPVVYKVYKATKDVFDVDNEIKEGLASLESKRDEAKKFLEDNAEHIVKIIRDDIKKSDSRFEIPDLEKF